MEKLNHTLESIYKLLQERLPAGCHCAAAVTTVIPKVNPAERPPAGTSRASMISIQQDLMTIREAYLELNVSPGTAHKPRQPGILTSIYHQKSVRLLRSEVMAAKYRYSSIKGNV